MESDDIKALLRRHDKLYNADTTWFSYFDDLTRVMLPRRYGFISKQEEPERRADDLFDGTPMRAARRLANTVSTILRPEGEQWAFIRAADDKLNDNDEAKEWLENAENRLKTAMYNPHARFRQATGEADSDLVVLGQGVIFTTRSREMNRLSYVTPHMRDLTIAYNDEGLPDTVFWRREWTLRQAAMHFGAEKLSSDLQQKLKNSPDGKALFLRVTLPRENGRVDAMLAKNLPFADLWIERDTEHLIREGGFHEFPFAVARWDTSSGERFASSPAMIALPDAETAQAMSETILIAGQRQADPTVFVPNDGSVSAGTLKPGGMAYYDLETAARMRGNPFFTLDEGINLPISRDMQRDVREQIDDAFFRSLFNLPLDREMTATEVIERKEELIREIGPVFGRLESDYVAPIVERSFNLMLRSGSFDDVPEVLQGQNVRFEYRGFVERLRKQTEALIAKEWALGIIGMSEAKPQILDNINEDEFARMTGEAVGVPHEIVTDRDEVEAIRAQRAEMQREAAERAKTEQDAAIAGTAARAAKDAGLAA